MFKYVIAAFACVLVEGNYTEGLTSPKVELGFSIERVKSIFKKDEKEVEYIHGGEPADEGEFPFQASLQSLDGEHFCGGSIIHPNWILTAGHCLYYADPEYMEVVTGTVDTRRNKGGGTVSEVASITIHPNYSHVARPFQIYNDIGLVKLSEPLEFNNLTNAVKLQQQRNFTSNKIVVSGWGTLSSGRSPTYLQKAILDIVQHNTCVKRYQRLTKITRNMLCAGDSQGLKASCSGDSGGPWTQQQGPETVQVGLVSFGPKSCSHNYLCSVAALVEPYLGWIKHIMETV